MVALILLGCTPQKVYTSLSSHISQPDAVTQITHRASKRDPMRNFVIDTASDDAVAIMMA